MGIPEQERKVVIDDSSAMKRSNFFSRGKSALKQSNLEILFMSIQCFHTSSFFYPQCSILLVRLRKINYIFRDI